MAARILVKLLPWLLTMALQVFYAAEIFSALKKRAVTHEEWTTVGSYFMYPLCALVVNIFGVLQMAAELTEADKPALLTTLLVLKNLTAGLEGAVDCLLIGFERSGQRAASYLLCIAEPPADESHAAALQLASPQLRLVDSSFQ